VHEANTLATMPPWGDWAAIDRATLVFIFRGPEVLLIRKLRGLGAGKINGPGGRIEPGETPIACAKREVQEELCVTPRRLQLRGELRFQFADGYSIHGHVFVADDCDGEPTATDEAIPLWTHCSAVPYDEMWADDKLWLPHLLAGKRFRGRFLFAGDFMLEHEVLTGDETAPDWVT
jgi:8-oxo-dGTP diphosphatase